MLRELFQKMKWDKNADRIGPDLPFTHWRLYFSKRMKKLCESKFKEFGIQSQMRPGAYAIGCSKIIIGDRVVIRPDCKLFGESETLNTSIIIEDDVLIACGVHIYINNHKFDDVNTPISNQGYYPDKMVILRKGCWIGANTIILPGVEIGENTVIGANSMVNKSFPKGIVAAGNPAKIIKEIKKV
jgi:acetyltransferase-like isoleucine patch superfamily enzyme